MRSLQIMQDPMKINSPKIIGFYFLKVAIPLGWILSLFLIVTHISILSDVQALYNNRAEGFNILVVFVCL